uniref:Cytochrome b n=1 Tax=Marsupiomonas sp. NIES 1824 TaxID=1562198 RepID=A0A6H0R0R2_9CHLO|nr:apocytochrome b [Marsupiomonas sp. NIES 1824]
MPQLDLVSRIPLWWRAVLAFVLNYKLGLQSVLPLILRGRKLRGVLRNPTPLAKPSTRRQTSVFRSSYHMPLPSGKGKGPSSSEGALYALSSPELSATGSPILDEPGLEVVRRHVADYPTGENLTDLWGFGSLAGICLVIQLATGVFLRMHYPASTRFAFEAVEQHIMRDVSSGWLLRYLHANGASFFFIVVYRHLFRGFYYSSSTAPRELVWLSGIAILLVMIITAFLGYVLPWGQMSFWGATVITSLASAIPRAGPSIVEWLWGGFSVDNATLNRFFRLHFVLPFVIARLAVIHLAALHQYGSTNPVGAVVESRKVTLYPYYFVKDLVAWIRFRRAYLFFVCFEPNAMGHPDNSIPANPLVTPPHIQPEWYFLPVYAILRSLPDKLGGVIRIARVFARRRFLPFDTAGIFRLGHFRMFHRRLFRRFAGTCVFLGWVGAKPVESPFVEFGQLSGIEFFLYFPLQAKMAQLERRFQEEQA